METLRSILVWERFVLLFSAALTLALLVFAVVVVPLLGMALGTAFGRDFFAKVGLLFFVGGFIGWLTVGTAIVLLSHLIGWLRRLATGNSN